MYFKTTCVVVSLKKYGMCVFVAAIAVLVTMYECACLLRIQLGLAKELRPYIFEERHILDPIYLSIRKSVDILSIE